MGAENPYCSQVLHKIPGKQWLLAVASSCQMYARQCKTLLGLKDFHCICYSIVIMKDILLFNDPIKTIALLLNPSA